MVRKCLVSLFLLAGFWISAQTATYADVRTLIESQIGGELHLDSRLIALQVWSVNSPESREQNKAFDKAYTTYEWAKLKGGQHGIVCITICLDQSSTATIAYQKDGITKLQTVSLQTLSAPGLQNLSSTYNVVYDSGGQKVYESLPSSKIFSSIHQLITR